MKQKNSISSYFVSGQFVVKHLMRCWSRTGRNKSSAIGVEDCRNSAESHSRRVRWTLEVVYPSTMLQVIRWHSQYLTKKKFASFFYTWCIESFSAFMLILHRIDVFVFCSFRHCHNSFRQKFDDSSSFAVAHENFSNWQNQSIWVQSITKNPPASDGKSYEIHFWMN